MDAKKAPTGTAPPKGINPFTCARCKKPSDGGIWIHLSAGFGSDYETCGVCMREICDNCFREMVPLFKDRLWLSDASNHSGYEETGKVIEEMKKSKIEGGLLPMTE